MKIGHCCAEPLPVVTMVMVSAAAEGLAPSAVAAIAVRKPSRPKDVIFMGVSRYELPRRILGQSGGARKPRHRRMPGQQRHHRADERLQSGQHGMEIEEKQLDADLFITTHPFGDEIGVPTRLAPRPRAAVEE